MCANRRITNPWNPNALHLEPARPCALCGKDITPDGGMMVEDGWWYCHEDHFREWMDGEYGVDGWRKSILPDGATENEAGGYYDVMVNGEWVPTGIFYTNWD